MRDGLKRSLPVRPFLKLSQLVSNKTAMSYCQRQRFAKHKFFCRYGSTQATTFFELIVTAFEELEDSDDQLHFAAAKAFLQHILDLPGKPFYGPLSLTGFLFCLTD